MWLRRVGGFLFLRNLVLVVLVGLLTSLVTEAISPVKKGKSQDLFWGMAGAVLATLFLAVLRGGIRLVPLVVVQVIGSVVLIFLGRLVAGGK